MTLPAAERRGIVVLQGMDIMHVHTPNNQILTGFKSPQRLPQEPARQLAGEERRVLGYGPACESMEPEIHHRQAPVPVKSRSSLVFR
jgi:hypothetical protein